MPKWNVLAVDDELCILDLIQCLLNSAGCTVDTADCGTLAWEKLDRPGRSYDFVILDRFMPGIDGIELLRRIKGDDRLKGLPVIMESGASSPEQIAEGMEAGAYYYLTKPYVPNTLLCIVRAVMADIEVRAVVSTQAARYIETLKYFTSAELRFSTLADVNRVAGILSAMCPDPDKVSTGMLELLLNAVEHGNLGITYNEKKLLMYDDCWEEDLKRRQLLPEFAGRFASVQFSRKNDSLEFRITDQGTGFDWSKYLEPDPIRSHDPNGRGIAMARRYSFSSVEFQGNGNSVVATVAL